MKTTVYGLLGMIKNGEAPQYIKYCGVVYIAFEFESTNSIDYEDIKSGDLLFADRIIVHEKLNDEIEILTKIPEENKIPEKIDTFVVDNEKWIETYNYGSIPLDKKALSNEELVIIKTLNQIIDYLKNKGE